jgi:hypothetical protein
MLSGVQLLIFAVAYAVWGSYAPLFIFITFHHSMINTVHCTFDQIKLCTLKQCSSQITIKYDSFHESIDIYGIKNKDKNAPHKNP